MQDVVHRAPSLRSACASPSPGRASTTLPLPTFSRYDFSHLSLDEIEEELRSQQANFERDVGRLRKQYERRGRALRAAKAAKEAAREQSS